MIDSQTDDSVGAQIAPSGTVPADAPLNTSASAPEPLRLTADQMILLEGSDKPVKFGEHVRGFQSKFTQASQELARARQALAERDRQIQQHQSERQRQQNPQVDPGAQLLEQLKTQPYMTGEEAVSMLQHMKQEVSQRDQILIGALQQLKQMQDVVRGLHSNHSENSFNSKIGNWVKSLGYGPEASEVAKEIYLAYTGDDLDNEFPQILAARMAQLEKMFDARKRAAVEGARRQPFVPGRGGAAGPSAPLKIKPNATSAEIADAFWVNRGGAETT